MFGLGSKTVVVKRTETEADSEQLWKKPGPGLRREDQGGQPTIGWGKTGRFLPLRQGEGRDDGLINRQKFEHGDSVKAQFSTWERNRSRQASKGRG